jgi:hypothetical protein
MQAGSIDRYFDGALLDAVPNDGPFTMGSGVPGSPQYQVTVSDFWIYSTEVTNQMYAWCVSLGKCAAPDSKDNPNFQEARYANYPVVGVDWQQAADYCSFAHSRLPTDAEWEKAASWDAAAGVKRVYPWGNQPPDCSLLNFKYCLNRTASVTSYGQGASFYGVYNMAGNVAEWVGDWFRLDTTKDAGAVDPTGPQTGSSRVIRSNGYDSDAVDASPSYRTAAVPTAHRPDLGFRCVVKDPAYFAPFCRMPVFYGIDLTTNGVSIKPCPDPIVTHAEACSVGMPVDYVTVQAASPTTLTITGLQSCDPPNNDAGVTHTCRPGITVQVTASCGVAPGGNASCPPNFMQDPSNPKQCISPGAVGACPAGFQYDGTLKCCTAAPGNDSVTPLCAVGQHLFNGTCVNDYGGPQPPTSVTYTTGGDGCPVPGSGNAPTLIPVPTDTPVPPESTPTPIAPVPTQPPPGTTSTPIIPFPTEPPPPGPPPGHGNKCDLKPKDCLFGLDKRTCTCIFP